MAKLTRARKEYDCYQCKSIIERKAVCIQRSLSQSEVQAKKLLRTGMVSLR